MRRKVLGEAWFVLVVLAAVVCIVVAFVRGAVEHQWAEGAYFAVIGYGTFFIADHNV